MIEKIELQEQAGKTEPEDQAMLEQDAGNEMHRREIKLADGRYLIFYTFDDAPDAATPGSEAKQPEPEPVAEPEAQEERHV
jgi:hypothetical protein